MSVKMASISCARNSGVASKMPVTPVVFWAVSAVMALMAYTPFAVMVLISAWMPAPPLESLPAIVNAVFMVTTSFAKNAEMPARRHLRILKQQYLPTLALSKSGHRSGQTAHSQPAFAGSLFSAFKNTTVPLHLQGDGPFQSARCVVKWKKQRGKYHEHHGLSWSKCGQ